MRMKFALGVLAYCVSMLAHATVVTYSDWSAFNSNVAGSTTIDFEAQNTGGSSSYQIYGTSLSVGDVTFTQPDNRLLVFGESYYQTSGLTSSYLNQNCCAPNGLIVDFASGIHSLGMDIGVLYNWGGASNPNDVYVTLSTGDVINITAPLLVNTGNSLDFFGFTSDVAFTSVTFMNPAEGLAIDNFTYGDAALKVSESGTFMLFALGLVGFGFTQVRKTR